MSFSFSGMFAALKSAIETVAPVLVPLENIATTLAPVVATMIPATAPAISAIEAGAASIKAIAPTAVQDVTAAIAVGEQMVKDGGPLLVQLEAMFAKLFHMHVVPGGQTIVLTAKTTAATVPATPPVTAAS